MPPGCTGHKRSPHNFNIVTVNSKNCDEMTSIILYSAVALWVILLLALFTVLLMNELLSIKKSSRYRRHCMMTTSLMQPPCNYSVILSLGLKHWVIFLFKVNMTDIFIFAWWNLHEVMIWKSKKKIRILFFLHCALAVW